jgi:hypothetical protein
VGREHRRLVRELAVSHRTARLLFPRPPVFSDAPLLPLGWGSRVLVLGSDVRVALSSGHTGSYDPVDRDAPAR